MSEPLRPIDWTGEQPPVYERGTLPKHVAIIMDGNGRWANQRGLTRTQGHAAGEAVLPDWLAPWAVLGPLHLHLLLALLLGLALPAPLYAMLAEAGRIAG